MGTDLYIYAEKFEDGAWCPVPKPKYDRCSGRVIPQSALEVGRSYELFSLLSGDRIGLLSSFADTPTTFQARGFPNDMNSIYRKAIADEYDKYLAESGNYGASWLSLRELQEFDWEQPVERQAYVEVQYADLFRKGKGFPDDFPQDAKLFHDLFGPQPAGTSKVAWMVPLRDYVGCSTWFIQRLSALAPGREVRIIYWFNS